MTARRIVTWAPPACGLLAFVVYAGCAAPGLYWFDSQELGAAAVRLGVPHPTGFPLFVLLGRALAFALPLGELAFRVHLGSALAAAVTVWTVARLVTELAGGDVPAAAGGLAAALVLGAGLTFFRQATVTEVYALTAAALVLAVRAALRVAAGGRGLALALFAGLCGLGVHASFRLLLGLPLVVLYLWRLRRGARWPVAALALVVLGAGGVALYLPLRSASGRVDALDWGHPRTAAAFLDHVDAGRIRRAFGAQMLITDATRVADHGLLVARRTDADLGTLALIAAAGGLLWLLARRGRRVAGALLLFVAAGDVAYAVWVNPMGIEDRQTGVPLAVALAALAGVGIVAGARVFGRAAPFAAGALALCCAVEPILGGAAAKLAGRASEAPRAWAEAALAAAPPSAVVLARSDSLAAGLFWLTLAEPVRPDVVGLARQHAWDVARSRALLGEAAPPTVAGLVALARARGRAVVWELADDGPPRGVAFLAGAPVGWIGAPGLPLAAQIDAAERAFAAPATDDQGGAETAARAFQDLGALVSHRRDFALAAVLTARALALGDDPGAHLNLARYVLAVGDDARARPHAEAALAARPRRADAWSLLGVLDARAGHCAGARARFGRALRLDPFDHDATVNLARIGLCRER